MLSKSYPNTNVVCRITKGISNDVSNSSSLFKYSNCKITKTQNPGIPKFGEKDLLFGKSHTDHMAMVLFEDGAWKAPEIVPYGPIQVDPFNSSLHYGISCFEGMKAFWGIDNKIRMLRPWDNMERLNTSMNRLAMDSPWPHDE